MRYQNKPSEKIICTESTGSSWLQKRTKLGKEVGLPYQSPPPRYFNKAMLSCCAEAKKESDNNMTINSFFISSD